MLSGATIGNVLSKFKVQNVVLYYPQEAPLLVICINNSSKQFVNGLVADMFVLSLKLFTRLFTVLLQLLIFKLCVLSATRTSPNDTG